MLAPAALPTRRLAAGSCGPTAAGGAGATGIGGGRAGGRPLASAPLRAHCRRRRQGAPCVQAAFTLTAASSNQRVAYTKPQCTVGSSAPSDVVVTGPQVAGEHALLFQKGKQTFLRPLVGESLTDDSRCWKDGVALRPRVAYVLASGSVLAFGSESTRFTIEFEEGAGSNPLLEMAMKGMVAGSSPDVKKALGGV